MYQTAKDYYRAQKHLASSIEDYGFSNTMLSILAFEILLKAIHLVETTRTKKLETKEIKKYRHDYFDIWSALPEATQDDLLAYAKQRYGSLSDYSDLKRLLKNWQALFSKGRYSYEKYEGMSEKEVRLRGEAWMNAGAQISEADFAYCPMELNGLTLVCSNFLRKRWQLDLHDAEV